MTKRKLAGCVIVGMLILGLVLLAVSCGGQTTTPTEPAAPTAPAAPTTPAAPSAPNIPAAHATAGCPVCHEQGIAGAPKWPADHAGRTEQTCTACHKPA